MVNPALFSSERSDWQTPVVIVDAVLRVMGRIDLDPCSNAHGEEANVPAASYYTEAEDGLKWVWYGRVYMNPPYARKIIDTWAEKLDQEVEAGHVEKALSLVPARPDTEWWATITRQASAVLFIRGRLRFKGAPSGAPFPSALIAHEIAPAQLARYTQHLGVVWTPERPKIWTYRIGPDGQEMTVEVEP